MIDASRLVLIWRIPKNAATMQKDQAVLFMLLTGHRRNLGGGAGTADALSGHRAAGNRRRVGPLDALGLHFCRLENPERLRKRANRNGFLVDNRKTYMV